MYNFGGICICFGSAGSLLMPTKHNYFGSLGPCLADFPSPVLVLIPCLGDHLILRVGYLGGLLILRVGCLGGLLILRVVLLPETLLSPVLPFHCASLDLLVPGLSNSLGCPSLVGSGPALGWLVWGSPINCLLGEGLLFLGFLILAQNPW